ncbi:OsmC family protein [Lentibacillus saliphilus]|uniref:OsmC family protein n=1 Tax=Lentibacillus saliphilus TaxID=2737028 RepID=UPI001C2FF18F|nr:OsmC family protein [Lentibacillus saliphilus]
MELTVKWENGMAFSSETPSGHTVRMDANETVGGHNTGARPTEMLLNGVAGCTGMDMISILRKMRIEPDAFHMDVTSERAEAHPKRFTKIHIEYALEGDLPEEKVVRAIQLSKDNYCTVSNSLNAEITASYSINGHKSNRII